MKASVYLAPSISSMCCLAGTDQTKSRDIDIGALQGKHLKTTHQKHI